MRILSGIQPSGVPHIGNYFGMMKNAVELQQKGEAYLFIADYHSLTTTPDPQLLRDLVKNMAIDFLACGIEPEKTVFFRQSDVPQVTELTWILNCFTSVGLLERAHSFKDKTAKGFVPNNGLFSYPVLMASDILLYDANLVPVGKDQKQHLEITRDIAQSFNHTHGEILTIPTPDIRGDVAVIPGVDGQKMSKSYNNTIAIFGGKKAIRKQVMSVVTDSLSLEEPKDPTDCNVVKLYKLFATANEVAELEDKYRGGNFGYGHAKQALFEKMWDYFVPMRERREELEKDPDYVEDILRAGARRANETANETIDRVRHAVGLR